MIRITKKVFESNGVIILTAWEGNKWCCVAGLPKDKQSPAEIAELEAALKLRACRPGAPRNGVRNAVKC
ncbi:hypothetical protein CPT_Slocum_103 [Serratia phage Slocum]|nr:hypothetical protein CPT_Slocum_103 [Serratia phage Slocum]